MPTEVRRLYLTFDDGPAPGVTEPVLDVLASFGAQATFFCLGQQAARYPKLVQRILAAGHSLGNHGHRHLNGWQTSTVRYVADICESAQILHAQSGFRSRLFRPPFGRLRWDAMWQLSRSYTIVMWDSLSMDYRGDISSAQVTQNVISSATCGSIVLWHDSELAACRMLECLPQVLQHFSAEGFSFDRLADGRTSQSGLLQN
jgi:peptidoglycan/xylan/chitin deacetylase (PgdA/CDA1 family)